MELSGCYRSQGGAALCPGLICGWPYGPQNHGTRDGRAPSGLLSGRAGSEAYSITGLDDAALEIDFQVDDVAAGFDFFFDLAADVVFGRQPLTAEVAIVALGYRG